MNPVEGSKDLFKMRKVMRGIVLKILDSFGQEIISRISWLVVRIAGERSLRIRQDAGEFISSFAMANSFLSSKKEKKERKKKKLSRRIPGSPNNLT